MKVSSPSSNRSFSNISDARIVAATFRTVSDADGFDDMMDAWGRRLQAQLADGTLGELDEEMREHVQLALAQFHKHEATAMANPVDEATDINAPAMVLSPSGLVVAVNKTGLSFFSALQGRSAGTDWLDPDSAEDFSAVMQSAQQRGNRKQAIIRTFSAEGISGLAEAYVIEAQQEHSNLIAIRSLDVEWSSGIDAILTEAFALTEAECAIARALFDTRDSGEIARRRDTSVHTVRTQLRTIQAKTSAASQTDLVRLLTLLAHRKQDRRDDGVMGWRDPWDNQAYIEGPDGLQIGYSWTGDPAGKPVLIVPSIMHGYALAEASEARLRDAGIKLWAIQRPGTCNSTARSFSRQTDMDAISCMIETLELGPVVALGLSGTVDLVRSAIRDPELYKAVLLAGLSSPTTRTVRSLFPLTQVAMIGAARKSPLLGKLIIETAQRNARRKGMDWLADRIFDNSPADQAMLRDPDIRPLLRNAFEIGLATNPDFALYMYQNSFMGFDVDLTKLAVPVHALVGTDVAHYHAPSIDEFAKGSALFTWEPIKNGGLKLLYQKPDLIVDHVIRMMEK